MTVSLEPHTVILSGKCGVEEVETLVAHLESHPGLAVDLGGATDIHTSIWQALMFLQPKIAGLDAASSMPEKVLLAMAFRLAKAG
ncbi:hypothetical protein E2F50_12215 [Rhizobium deserti]|uniref:STAS domain-containing protein n=1 Tax=Rhizobium deserti TaxID=2547961 RepID=A0A4R5UGL9_9HYPH|nr:hypothetical protein [Rhizobium deserti]TDK35029.1 hypothetical protein E2F50_12215 [Rhizobium deserti]